ncbi:MAG TPA: beta-L-arabinofuranosidase domain-containing protein [Terriglobia bacterium]|nr:beta-L-arabinofuranosidase domain-containing protein [Terriglobia bacterium]
MKRLLGASLAPALVSGRPSRKVIDENARDAKTVVLTPFNYSGIRLLDGPLKEQYDATRDYYYNVPNDDILKGFRQRVGLPAPGRDMGGWCQRDAAEVLGQWLSGMSRMYRATSDSALMEKTTYLMREWAKAAAKDGEYFSNRRNLGIEHSHYIFDKTVCGLVDMCLYGGQKEALPILETMVDRASAILDRTRTPASPDQPDSMRCGNEWYTLAENLYRAYQLTGNIKYRTFGDVWRYPTYWDKFNLGPNPDIHGLHAYSHVNALSSAAMTYAVTGEPQYLNTCVNAFDYFQRTQCYATGGYGPDEKLVNPDGSLGKSLEESLDTFETPCGSWSIFKLSRYLIGFTGEARYGDWIEQMIYNGIGAALPMHGYGRTFYYSDYMLGGCHKVYYEAAWPCCSGTFIQDVADYHNVIYFYERDGLFVNLFVPSALTWNCNGEEVEVEQMTKFPESDITTLTVRPKRPVAFELNFRVPGWARGVAVKVNDSEVEVAAEPGTWAKIARIWQPGDRVTIRMPMELVLKPIDAQHPYRVAAVYGPVVLVQERETFTVPARNDPSKWIKPQGGPLEFHAEQHSTATFVPFYRIGHNTSYRMYFDVVA